LSKVILWALQLYDNCKSIAAVMTNSRTQVMPMSKLRTRRREIRSLSDRLRS
jgi:hypothetical protein